jgi:hypothetical protein
MRRCLFAPLILALAPLTSWADAPRAVDFSRDSIVLSASYRQSSRVTPELLRRDPLNVLLARQARLRLEAETENEGE